MDCPKCGAKLECLSGESAHPDNWYCIDDACGYRAWESRQKALGAVLKEIDETLKVYTEADLQEKLRQQRGQDVDELHAALKDLYNSHCGMTKSCGHEFTCTCPGLKAKELIEKYDD